MSLSPVPFKVSFSDAQLARLKYQLEAANIGPMTYESSPAGEAGDFGVQHNWLTGMKEYWENGFDWRAQEARINEFPQFTALLPQSAPAAPLNMHFIHSRSQSKTARPLLLLHGWPGSFIEFLDVVSILEKTGDYHIIVPSFPGYLFSDKPSALADFGIQDAARVVHQLMAGLGYSKYAVQGGDWGAWVARILAVDYDSCEVVHLNFFPTSEGSKDGLTSEDLVGLERRAWFYGPGSAYLGVHGTKPATIGAVLASSPVALLAWVGEKFIAWSDTPATKDQILTSLTLYWFTNTYPSSIYSYRHLGEGAASSPRWLITKPTGFSSFAKEIIPTPRSWAEKTCNLTYYKYHSKGGHFAALENPSVLAADLIEFLQENWKEAAKTSSL